MPLPSEIPLFEQLPFLEGDNERHSWDVFGRTDNLGCLNFVTEKHVVEATQAVRHGEVVSLNLPLDQPQPQFWTQRGQLTHHHERRGNLRDDHLDGLQLQGSTQWDGFRHQRYRQFGFYGGRQDTDLDEGGELGIEVWAARGIIARGVLADVATERLHAGDAIQPDRRLAIGASLIEKALDYQHTELRPGDVLLVRTGWLEWYLGMGEEERQKLSESLSADLTKAELPGLDPAVGTAAWLWDHRVAAVAFDNPTLETLPYRREEGWAHNRLLPLLGMPLGELWKLDELSLKCAALETYSFLLCSAPLHVTGAAGSPATAYAVF